MIDLYRLLQSASLEKDVETAYTQVIKWYYPNNGLYHYCGCDACLANELIIEYKYDVNLKSKMDVCKVLTQVIFYLRRLREKGLQIPSGVLIGDVNECAILEVSPLLKYLNLDIDWSIRPSDAYKIEKLINHLLEDPNIDPKVFDIGPKFNFKDVCKIIDKITPLKAKRCFSTISIEVVSVVLLIINIILTLSMLIFK